MLAITIPLVRSGSGRKSHEFQLPTHWTAFPSNKALNEYSRTLPLMNDRFSIRSNTLEARLKLPIGRLSLFDAVPFLTSPHSWPRVVLRHSPELEGNKQGKEIVKFADGLANVASGMIPSR
jgi:hypothetical protein